MRKWPVAIAEWKSVGLLMLAWLSANLCPIVECEEISPVESLYNPRI